MRHRTLGGSSIEVAVLGLGGNTFGPPRLERTAAIEVVHAALSMGVTFFDTALIYGQGRSEEFLGEALTGRRDKAVVATKFHLGGLNGQDPAQRVRDHCEQSLRKLRTDRIDLLQVHMPSDEIETDALVAVLAQLIHEGKIRTYGVSNYASWRLSETVTAADRLSEPRPVGIQTQYSLLHRQAERELLQACDRYGVSLIPYHPLAGGFLTGKYRKGQAPPPGSRGAGGSPIVVRMSTDRNWAIIAELEAFAADHGHTVAELAIAWLAAKPQVASVIAGVNTVPQLEENLRGALWELNADQISQLEAIAFSPHDALAEDYAAQTGPTKA